MSQAQLIMFLAPDNRVHIESPSINGARHKVGEFALDTFPFEVQAELIAQRDQIKIQELNAERLARAALVERKKRVFALTWERSGPKAAREAVPEFATSYTYGRTKEKVIRQEATLDALNDL